MTTLNERLRSAVLANYDAAEVRLPDDHNDIYYQKDEHGCYWVSAEILVSPFDLFPNTNPVYSVWECEDFSKGKDWSDVSDWRLDERFQCVSDDDSGTDARWLAHDRAKHLRQSAGALIYAVRPGINPPPLLPRPLAPAAAGDDQ